MLKKSEPKGIKMEFARVLILTVCVLSCLCGFIYWSVQEVIITNENEYLLVSVQRLQNRFNYMYDHLENIAVTMSGDDKLKYLLQADMQDKVPYVDYMEKLVAQFKILESDIADISLVSENMYYSTIYHDEDLDDICGKMQGNMFQWVEIRNSSFMSLKNKQPFIIYGNNIMDNGKKVGTLLISVNLSYFTGELDSMSFKYVLNRENWKFSMNTGEINSDIWKKLGIINREQKLTRYGKYYVKIDYLEKMKCYLISLNATNIKYLNANMSFLQALIWGCIISVLVFLILLFVLVNNRLVKPLQIFYKNIREIRNRKQRYLKHPIELGGCLEIQEIGNEFTEMLQDIENLNKTIFDNTTRLYELELKRQKAELAYLRGQIDPHFLYNTLEVMRKQALEKEVPELAQMAIDMGKIFRYSAKGEPIVSLKDEVEIISAYVRIQEKRFQGRLKVFHMIQENLMNLVVMKMLLQPLVENAIYHGIEPKTEKGSIFVGARLENEDLILTVKDNGVGISKEKLDKIREKLQKDTFDTSRHVGIINTHARIRLMYGEKYGLWIDSNEADGTSVFIRIPMIEKKER